MISAALIKENMEVLGSDGIHVGTVDHIEGAGEVRLASDDPDARGGHYCIPLSWVVHIEMKVHLNQSSADVKARWTSL
jgi:hypothetical protein